MPHKISAPCPLRMLLTVCLPLVATANTADASTPCASVAELAFGARRLAVTRQQPPGGSGGAQVCVEDSASTADGADKFVALELTANGYTMKGFGGAGPVAAKVDIKADPLSYIFTADPLAAGEALVGSGCVVVSTESFLLARVVPGAGQPPSESEGPVVKAVAALHTACGFEPCGASQWVRMTGASLPPKAGPDAVELELGFGQVGPAPAVRLSFNFPQQVNEGFLSMGNDLQWMFFDDERCLVQDRGTRKGWLSEDTQLPFLRETKCAVRPSGIEVSFVRVFDDEALNRFLPGQKVDLVLSLLSGEKKLVYNETFVFPEICAQGTDVPAQGGVFRKLWLFGVAAGAAVCAAGVGVLLATVPQRLRQDVDAAAMLGDDAILFTSEMTELHTSASPSAN